MLKDRAKRVGLPPRPFLYTLDQIAMLLNIEVRTVREYLHYEGRSVGSQDRDDLQAVNIAGPNEKPKWRVSEGELIRWMKRKGLRYYERGWLSDANLPEPKEEYEDNPIGNQSWD